MVKYPKVDKEEEMSHQNFSGEKDSEVDDLSFSNLFTVKSLKEYFVLRDELDGWRDLVTKEFIEETYKVCDQLINTHKYFPKVNLELRQGLIEKLYKLFEQQKRKLQLYERIMTKIKDEKEKIIEEEKKEKAEEERSEKIDLDEAIEKICALRRKEKGEKRKK